MLLLNCWPQYISQRVGHRFPPHVRFGSTTRVLQTCLMCGAHALQRLVAFPEGRDSGPVTLSAVG
jgi:hypothetical protein